MKVARLYTIDDIRIEEDPVPTVGPGEALVRTRACGICTGDLMGWYMKRKAPLVFGHEPAGEVVEVGDGVDSVVVGDRVFAHHHAPCGRCRVCRRGDYVHCKTWRRTSLNPGGMAEFFVVPADNLAGDTLRLPDSVDFAAGSLIEPAACVVKSLRRSGVKAGDTMVVIGVGIMGQLHVALGVELGARVIAADRVPFRLKRAKELGAARAVHVDEHSLEDAVREATDGAMADVVIVGPGSIGAMKSGIAVAGPGSTVVLFTASMPDDEFGGFAVPTVLRRNLAGAELLVRAGRHAGSSGFDRAGRRARRETRHAPFRIGGGPDGNEGRRRCRRGPQNADRLRLTAGRAAVRRLLFQRLVEDDFGLFGRYFRTLGRFFGLPGRLFGFARLGGACRGIVRGAGLLTGTTGNHSGYDETGEEDLHDVHF